MRLREEAVVELAVRHVEVSLRAVLRLCRALLLRRLRELLGVELMCCHAAVQHIDTVIHGRRHAATATAATEDGAARGEDSGSLQTAGSHSSGPHSNWLTVH